MAAQLDSVAKYIAEQSNWGVSNLELQKLMYLAQMIHMGRYEGKPLFEGSFQAWDLGPVEPSLYHRAKIFGSSPVKDIFVNAKTFKSEDYRRKVMDDVCKRFLKYSGGELVEITHWDEGAWAKHYLPGVKGIRIPDESIKAEYDRRQQ